MVNPIKQFRLDHMFFASFAGLIMVLTLIVTWIAYSVSSQQLQKTTSFYQQGLLAELNKEMVLQLNTIEQISLSTSRNIDFLDYLSLDGDEYARIKKFNDILQYLTNITNSTGSIYSIHLYVDHPVSSDRQRSVQFIDFKQLSREPWYASVQNTDFTWIGEHTIQTFQGRVPVVSFARKIYSNKNEYKGLILINVKASVIHQVLEGQSHTGNRLLFDTAGHLLAQINDVPVKHRIEQQTKLLEAGVGSRRLQRENGDDLSLMVWSRQFNSNLVLIEVTPWELVTQGSVELARIMLIVGFSTVLAALCLSLSIAKQLMKPIRLLVQAMSKYMLDSSKVQLPSDYRNEFGYLFNGYRRQMERIDELYGSLEIQHRLQREAEVKALQANINPHFLYNTLDQINWMAMESGQHRISHILELVGRMFRIGLSGGESLIPLEQELQHVECYLGIQQIRWQEGLEYRIEIQEDLKAFYIPKITLQPFVENAILHGFHGRASGLIVIRAELQEQVLCITVSDNGRGLKPTWRDKGSRRKGGYGIRNVRERIGALFGPTYGLILENQPEGGARVTIRLPLISEESDLYGNRESVS
ncbi:sensor histidine kinase [Paenibacillus filicis]|uniref:Sensor histidine kinase n=1 Tax=Paenibacillus gyeongsangnamensis TaxID=3388067 RepID=A0ABT4Q4V8_9BACL|nr:sensor histidine kinase [Paenibacillus filicis]MCZ8511899.1 sensor histidine kinase [Paenibacillus filicis]